MGPCSSLFTMPRLRRSTASRSLLESLSSLPATFCSSAARKSSAFFCRALMAGTAPRLSCQPRYFAFSSASRISASRTSRWRMAVLRATTALRSSTLYEATPSRSLVSRSTLRGTEMSTNMIGRSWPTFSCSSTSLVTKASSEDVDVNTMSLWRTRSQHSSMRPIWISMSGYSAASASMRGRERFRRMALEMPALFRCVSSSLVILPAPMMRIDASLRLLPTSASARDALNSAAAEEMLTAPRLMAVSERTRLPEATAVLRSLLTTLPAEPPTTASRSSSASTGSSVPRSKQALTWARIWPSPTTRESRPPATRRRCHTASSPESMKRDSRSLDMGMPERSERYLVASYMAARASEEAT
mmetsp:Transcript_25628/g.80229  ORF Transcript_25628/g.80229 Transcript_25628/m.80229 type:complete len:359 (-) Transcript_25628:262-1338(-)